MKKIYLILFIIFLTGCSAKYDLVIDNDKISESASLTFPKEVTSQELFDGQSEVKKSVYSDGINFYKMKKSSDDENYYLNYSFDHAISKYAESSFLNLCYDKKEIINDEDSIKINTDDRFNCIVMDDGAYMDEVVINIKTDLKVVNNNADKIDGNTYTWIIDYDNYTNKPINIEIKKNSSMLHVDSSVSINILLIIIFFLLITVFIYFGYNHVKKKSEESNRF